MEIPLVSVPVITYNSSKYVLETLESIKAQTYQNIELIISDDCSTDNTVEICHNWLNNNSERFIRAVILESPINTGISANANRAESECNGKYVKGIAGDDMLLPECIDSFVSFMEADDSVVYAFCGMHVIGGDKKEREAIEQYFDERNDHLERLNVREQLTEILNDKTPPAPTAFYNREKKDKLGIENDERIKLIEDWPKWIKILRCGVRLRFIKEKMVVYRMGGISTSKRWESVSVFKSRRQVFFYYIFADSYNIDKDKAIDSVIEFESNLYQEYLLQKGYVDKLRNIYFLRAINKIIKKLKNR